MVSKFYLKNQTKKIKNGRKNLAVSNALVILIPAHRGGVPPPLAYRLITNTSIKETETVYII